MKIDTILNPIKESVQGPKWVFPSPKALEQEYNIEYKHHIQYDVGPIFPTLKDFLTACKNGHPMVITERLDDKIYNRSHTNSKQELLSLIRSYRSYPEFRNENTIDHLYNQMNGGELDMPIILFHKGKSRIMSGNTRMDVAFQMGLNPTCLVVEY